MEEQLNNMIRVSLSSFASLCYCYFISSSIPKPIFRLLSLLPVIFLFTIIPFFFSYLFPIAIASVFISWLANFKLLLFVFHHPPLSSNHSLLQFISIALLPVKIIQTHDYPSPQNPKFPAISSLIWPLKVLLFGLLVNANGYKDRVDQRIVLVMYCLMVYLVVDIVFGVANALVYAILNLELEPPSNHPYFSTSLQDFWGRRWNLAITNLLRYTVYKPVRSSRLINHSGKWAPPVGVFATFLVSGLMHELLFYHLTRATPTWEVTCFFILHGACVVVEFKLKSVLGGRWRVHWSVSGPLTVGFVVATAMWLFFPPIIRSGVIDNAIRECKVMLNFAMEIML